jgi:hypothetical protein
MYAYAHATEYALMHVIRNTHAGIHTYTHREGRMITVRAHLCSAQTNVLLVLRTNLGMGAQV